MESDLIPLLTIHKQDKKLSFLAVMIMVKLTEMPHIECYDKQEYYQHLQKYKELFINAKVCEALIEHMAHCI
jgi:hypothetical protein